MEMPKPTDVHKRLEILAGDWTGREEMPPSPWAPEGTIADGRTTSHLALGGFSVIADYEQRQDGRVTFSGHAVYTYSTEEQCYVCYWFDCMGTAPNLFKGNFDGEVLTLISDESGPGGPRFSRLTYDLSEPGKLKSKMEVSQDGENWDVFMKARYTRG